MVMMFSTVEKRQLPVRIYFVFEKHLEKSILYFLTNFKVFDKSISNTFFQKHFVFEQSKKSIFYNTGYLYRIKIEHHNAL